MSIVVKVADVDVTDKVDGNKSTRWTDQLNGRGQLSISFCDEPGGFRPRDGHEVLVIEDGVRRFGGHLAEPDEYASPEMDLLFWDCTADDFSAIADRYTVTRVYVAQTVDAIVKDIIAKDIDSDENITTTGVDEGPTIARAVFNDVTVAEAFNQLAELTGRAWWFDANRGAHFKARTAVAAPSSLTTVGTDPTVQAGTVRIRADRQNYRNKQILKAGKDLTLARTETLVGDGTRRVFGVAFPIGATPTVKESRAGAAFAAKTVGILGVDSGKDWYWNVGLAQVSQDTSGTVLAAPTDTSDPATGDRVQVTYQGQYAIKVQFTNTAEVAARAALEGGGGVHTHVESRPNIESAAQALDTTLALISRYGQVGRIVTAASLKPGFAAGQLVPVELPVHGIDEDMLIESVDAEVIPGTWTINYTVRAMSGDPFGGWQKFFRDLVQGGKPYVIEQEGEILILVRVATAPVLAGATVDVDTAAPVSTIGTMTLGRGEIGAAA